MKRLVQWFSVSPQGPRKYINGSRLYAAAFEFFLRGKLHLSIRDNKRVANDVQIYS
jgi:hypothetical protein